MHQLHCICPPQDQDKTTKGQNGTAHSENIRKIVSEMYKQKNEGNNHKKEKEHVHTEELKPLVERRKEEQKEWDKQNKEVYKKERIQRNKKPEHRTGYLLPGVKIMEPKSNIQMIEIPTLNILTWSKRPDRCRAAPAVLCRPH